MADAFSPTGGNVFLTGLFAVTTTAQPMLTGANFLNAAGHGTQQGTITISNQSAGSVFVGNASTVAASGASQGLEIPAGAIVTRPFFGQKWIIGGGNLNVSFEAVAVATTANGSIIGS